jgi:hypothetical protein
MVIAYRAVTFKGSEHLSSLEGPYLHIGNLSLPNCPYWKVLDFCVRKDSSERSLERCFSEAEWRIRSVIARSPGAGPYSFPIFIDGHDGHFMTPDGLFKFALDSKSNPSFIDVLLLEPGRIACLSIGFVDSEGLGRSEHPGPSNLGILSSDMIRSADKMGSLGDFVEPPEGLWSENFDVSERLISLDFINSINIVGSNDDIESDHMQESPHSQSFDQTSGSSLTFVATGSALALLISLSAIGSLIGCRRGLSESIPDTTESELDLFADGHSSRRADGCFVSEENALSSNGRFSTDGMMIQFE